MGRPYTKINFFSPWDSNTIDDVSGMKVKLSSTLKRWEGFYTRDGYHPRQPQDFPVVPQKQVVYENARSEQVEAEGAVDGFEDDIV